MVILKFSTRYVSNKALSDRQMIIDHSTTVQFTTSKYFGQY